MTKDHRQALIIQRAICYLIAIAGIVLLWVSASHAAIPCVPTFHASGGVIAPESVVPDPGTLLMLTGGIGCAFVKLRGTTV